jgi:hypothetical protein
VRTLEDNLDVANAYWRGNRRSLQNCLSRDHNGCGAATVAAVRGGAVTAPSSRPGGAGPGAARWSQRRLRAARGGPGGERWSPRTSIPLGDVCRLGNIALRSGRRVTWDPAREVVTGDEEQARMVNRPYLALWRMPDIPA